MPMSVADLRFLFDRGTGLIQRGMTSLRTRGVRASWQRVLTQFRTVPASRRPALYLPLAQPFAPFALPTSEAPRASIVIPVFNQFAHTLACLRAITAHAPTNAFEVIVVDDGSSDETEASLTQVTGLRYHRRTRNGGFIAACNDGAALARGEYLIFLNNDTVPQPDWLEALLRTFEQHPGTGLVGAQLVYPDGLLQEAGGVVFADGSAENRGKFESPLDPRFAHVREAHYCSGAALAIPTALFRELGEFDSRYAPAYYEDTDLAFAVRAAGHRVLYQPAACVVHLEGITSGTDVRQGAKAYQVHNRQVFADKWRHVLASHPRPGVTEGAQPGASRSVLVIDTHTPRPDRDSASLRLFNLMTLLRQEGTHVVFVPTDLSHDAGYTQALQQQGVEVWYAPFAGRLPAWVRAHGHRFHSVLVCRHYVLRELLPLLRRHAPQARVVFDTVDLHYLRERRGAEVAGDATLLRAAERTRQAELALIQRSDVTLVVSEIERTLLAGDAPGARVEVLSNLHQPAAAGKPFAERADIVFVGGFRHPPNVDAVQWFVADIWPRILAEAPGLQFHCIGGDVPESIQALASRPGVVVHGHVPAIEPYMAGTRVAVAPLRYGAGVKGKVNLSMAHGQPVVATRCAVEGMHLRDGEDVLVADDAASFAEAVLRAYRHQALWEQLSANGRNNVARHFSLDAARAVVRAVLLDA